LFHSNLLLRNTLTLRLTVLPATAAFSFSILASAAIAQVDRGSIAGTISEPSQAILQGAQVILQPGGQTAISDAQGNFIIAGIKPGHYTVQVSYLGFRNNSVDLDVTAGQIARVNATLTIDDAQSNVTVRPDREIGEAESLERQRVAVNIVQVLPSEIINSLPNVNIADAAGRLPSVSIVRDEGEGKYVQIRGTEPRLNNVTVDGVQLPSPENVRFVKLDTIPADLVESIELNKTLTADMNGDGIGGSLNLVTRLATDTPYFAVEGLFGHTPINGVRQENQEFVTYGRRFLGNKLGFLATGSYDYNARGINDIEPGQSVNNIVDNAGNTIGTVNSPNTIDLRNYYYDRTRYGAGGTLDYKFDEHTSAYLKGIFSHLDDFGEDSINRLNFGTFISPTQTDQTGNTQYQNIYRRPSQELFSTSLGGRKEMGQSILSGHVALSQAKLTGGFTTSTFNGIAPTIAATADPTVFVTNQDGVAFNTATNDVFLPGARVTATHNNAGIYDGNQNSLATIGFQDNHTYERDIEGQVDYSRGYTWGPNFGTWAAGFQARDVVKNQLDNQPTATALSSNILLSQFPSNRDESNYYFGNYQTGPQAQSTDIVANYNANPAQFSLAGGGARDLRADFHISERVIASYLENTITHGRFRYNSGVRIESTSNGVSGFQPDPTGAISPVYTTDSYVYVLPSAGIQYNLDNYTDFRAAYSIGLARPNYGDLAPFIQVNQGAPLRNSASPYLNAGNPNLRATWAENLDLLGEHYLKGIGVIQGGVFYKQIFNDIFQSVAPVQYVIQGQTQPSTVFASTPINGGSSHLIGAEASYEQHLTRLPGALSGTGYRFNYSYVASVAGVPGRSDKPSLAGDAPNNWNVDLTYDKYGLSARMGLTHNDAYVSAYQYTDGTPIAGSPTNITAGGPLGPGGDNYYYPHTQVDAQVNYMVPKAHGASIVAQFLNLNNEVFGFYNGQEQYPVQREYYSPTYTFGLRWTSNAEHGSVFKQ